MPSSGPCVCVKKGRTGVKGEEKHTIYPKPICVVGGCLLATNPIGADRGSRSRRVEVIVDELLFVCAGDGSEIAFARSGPMVGWCPRQRLRKCRRLFHKQVCVSISSDLSFPYNRKSICVKRDFSKIVQVARRGKKTHQHKYLACNSILSAKLPRSTSFFLS